jgi:hypothetical protein
MINCIHVDCCAQSSVNYRFHLLVQTIAVTYLLSSVLNPTYLLLESSGKLIIQISILFTLTFHAINIFVIRSFVAGAIESVYM